MIAVNDSFPVAIMSYAHMLVPEVNNELIFSLNLWNLYLVFGISFYKIILRREPLMPRRLTAPIFDEEEL